MSRRSFPAPACLLAALLVSGCGTPPNREMDQAQGAIDAARAAGADRYATTEYSAATDALKNANDAVIVRDYRLALNYALESREHAQNAARGAADEKARVRADVERAITELAALVTRGRARLAAAERARVSGRPFEPSAETLSTAEAALQKARAVIAEGDYLSAGAALEGVKERVEQALNAIDTATASQSPRRRR